MHDPASLAGRSTTREDLEHDAHTSPRPSNPVPRRSLSLARHRQGEEATAMDAVRWALVDKHNSQHASWVLPLWVAQLQLPLCFVHPSPDPGPHSHCPASADGLIGSVDRAMGCPVP